MCMYVAVTFTIYGENLVFNGAFWFCIGFLILRYLRNVLMINKLLEVHMVLVSIIKAVGMTMTDWSHTGCVSVVLTNR